MMANIEIPIKIKVSVDISLWDAIKLHKQNVILLKYYSTRTLTNEEIGKILLITKQTVGVHLKRAFKKLGRKK